MSVEEPREAEKAEEEKPTEIDENPGETEETENPENPEIIVETGVLEPKYFKTKKIRFGPIEYHILTQNQNGPCPLIAIVNALVLKGKLQIPARYVVTSTDLLTLLTNIIISRTPTSNDEKAKEIFENNLSDVLPLMETIVNGLDVNVKFSSVEDFEFTPALSLFDLVLVKLYHVWLPDPQFPVVYNLICKMNYNELVVKMCEENDDEAEWARSFYEESMSQITFHGLASLMATMIDGELAVVFHNNHFSTVLKRRDEIFKLVTDEGFADEPGVVWETFSDTDGDCIFVNSDFGNFKPTAHQAPPPQPAPPTSEVVDNSPIESAVEAVEIPEDVVRNSSQNSTPRHRNIQNTQQSSRNPPSPKENSKCRIM